MIRLRLEQRATTPAWFYVALPVAAILATLVLCAGLVMLAGGHVLEAYGTLFLSPVASRFALVETAVKAAPLIFTGLAVAIAFRARFWNIGGEGQLLMGAMAAAFIGGRESLPEFSLIPLMILAGALAGGIWAMVPALLRTRYKVDEVVVSLLLNFIVFYGMMALLDGVWKDPLSGYPDSPDIREEAGFPILLPRTRLHLGVGLALLAAPLVFILMRKTVLGFAIRAVGENAQAAAYAGFSTARVTMATALLSGAMAGLAGVGEVGGLHYQVMAGISPGYGYTGIVIAMLAGLNPLGVVPAAFFFSIVITGAEAMSRATGIPVYLSDVIQGTALITMLIALLFTRYRLRLKGVAHG
ncbi:MAG: ABC transporter permease [Zavarzinia sp.]|nr:ABC transporter permease [Zavarzinia sp.]